MRIVEKRRGYCPAQPFAFVVIACARWWAHRAISRDDHIDRAILHRRLPARHGLQQGKIPHEMRLHSH
jgi:hypothetical protein